MASACHYPVAVVWVMQNAIVTYHGKTVWSSTNLQVNESVTEILTIAGGAFVGLLYSVKIR